MKGNKLDDDELLWRQYNLLTELYKFYLDMLVNSSLLIYGITGGIVAYTFSNAGIPIIKWSLILPLLFCMATGLICLRGVGQAREVQQEIKALRAKLQIGLAPHVDVLVYALLASGIMFILVSAGLLIVFLLV